MEKNDIKTFTGLVRDVAPFIDGIGAVEQLIGKDGTFHDAEIDEIHISRADNTVSIKMWTDSGISRDKYYFVTWRFDGIHSIQMDDYNVNSSSAYVYELRFESIPYYPELIKTIFDGTGIEISCRHIALTVEEAPEEDDK